MLLGREDEAPNASLLVDGSREIRKQAHLYPFAVYFENGAKNGVGRSWRELGRYAEVVSEKMLDNMVRKKRKKEKRKRGSDFEDRFEYPARRESSYHFGINGRKINYPEDGRKGHHILYNYLTEVTDEEEK